MREDERRVMERQQLATSGMRLAYDPRQPQDTDPERRAKIEAAMPAAARARLRRRARRAVGAG